MRLSYFLLADAANTSADGKINALGAGIRQIHAPALPAAITAVVVAGAEATRADFGEHRVRLSILRPDGSKQTFAESTITIEDRPGLDDRLPLSVSVQLSLRGVVIEQAGRYVLRLQIGPVRGDYPIVVEQLPGAGSVTD